MGSYTSIPSAMNRGSCLEPSFSVLSVCSYGGPLYLQFLPPSAPVTESSNVYLYPFQFLHDIFISAVKKHNTLIYFTCISCSNSGRKKHLAASCSSFSSNFSEIRPLSYLVPPPALSTCVVVVELIITTTRCGIANVHMDRQVYLQEDYYLLLHWSPWLLASYIPINKSSRVRKTRTVTLWMNEWPTPIQC